LKSGRTLGILIILGSLAVAAGGVAWLAVTAREGRLQGSGAVMGAICGGVVLLPLLGVGIIMLVRSGQEAVQDAEQAELRKILDVVKSRGQVPISDLVLEMKSDRQKVQGQIHSLVGMGLFSGYINWDEGTLYSSEAANIRDLQRCKHCGGEVSFAGKGVLSCQHCGTEYFLS
jgi:hypothetical protein